MSSDEILLAWVWICGAFLLEGFRAEMARSDADFRCSWPTSVLVALFWPLLVTGWLAWEVWKRAVDPRRAQERGE